MTFEWKVEWSWGDFLEECLIEMRLVPGLFGDFSPSETAVCRPEPFCKASRLWVDCGLPQVIGLLRVPMQGGRLCAFGSCAFGMGVLMDFWLARGGRTELDSFC
jgi:hypothetical protein